MPAVRSAYRPAAARAGASAGWASAIARISAAVSRGDRGPPTGGHVEQLAQPREAVAREEEQQERDLVRRLGRQPALPVRSARAIAASAKGVLLPVDAPVQLERRALSGTVRGEATARPALRRSSARASPGSRRRPRRDRAPTWTSRSRSLDCRAPMSPYTDSASTAPLSGIAAMSSPASSSVSCFVSARSSRPRWRARMRAVRIRSAIESGNSSSESSSRDAPRVETRR